LSCSHIKICPTKNALNDLNKLFFAQRKGESNEQQTENQPIKKPMSSSSKQSDEKTKTAATSRELKLASELFERDGEASLSTTSENRSKATPNENSIEMLMTLGFDRQAAIKALEVSHNDVDTAAEFLLEVLYLYLALKESSSSFWNLQ
jgi:uncharacterized UBP type Zn finger protein